MPMWSEYQEADNDLAIGQVAGVRAIDQHYVTYSDAKRKRIRANIKVYMRQEIAETRAILDQALQDQFEELEERCKTERCLVQGSGYPIKLYTDHQSLIKCLRSEDTTGRIAR